MQNIADQNILNMVVLNCLLDEINGPTAFLENARAVPGIKSEKI